MERRLTAFVGSSVLAGREAVLFSLIMQARPLLMRVDQSNRLADLALEQFMHYISYIVMKEGRGVALNGWLEKGGDTLLNRWKPAGCCLNITAAAGTGEYCQEQVGRTEKISNRMSLVLRVMVDAKELQNKLSDTPPVLSLQCVPISS